VRGRKERTRFDTEVGRRVTRLLVEARATQRRLALRLGVPHSTLNQMITGRLPPWPDLEARSRRALGLMEDAG
jgi:transcriptional regulator with XRE-family HTH domain